jgi:hypothetical protein
MIKSDDALAQILTLMTDRASAARDRVAQLRDVVTRELELRPFRTLALAVGGGYLLAGGLFSRLTFRLLSLGARLAILPVIASELAAIRENSPEVPPPRSNSRRPRSGNLLRGSQT